MIINIFKENDHSTKRLTWLISALQRLTLLYIIIYSGFAATPNTLRFDSDLLHRA